MLRKVANLNYDLETNFNLLLNKFSSLYPLNEQVKFIKSSNKVNWDQGHSDLIPTILNVTLINSKYCFFKLHDFLTYSKL